MIELWLSLETNHGMSVVFVQHISWLMVRRFRAQRRLMAMEKVNHGCAMLMDWER
jgi:hypothetical protein